MAANSGGASRRPDDAADARGTATATTMIPATDEDRHRALGHEADHDGEDDEAHHVVGHRGAEHDAGLGGGQGPEVAEHPGGDADARGRERGADEQRGVEVLAHQRHRADAEDHRGDHADRGDQHRRAADLAELARSISMPDLEQEEDHADLAEGAQHLVAAADGVEHRRADEDAGDDLADDRRDADALGDLGGHLGGDQHDQDVAEDLGDVHGLGRGSGQGSGRAPGGHGRAVPARCVDERWDWRRRARRRCRARWTAAPRRADELPLADLRVRALDGELELGVGEGAHLRDVHAVDLHLRRRADAALHERVLDLEEGEGDAEDHGPDDEHADRLGAELAAGRG